MRKLLFLSLIVAAASCNQSNTLEAEAERFKEAQKVTIPQTGRLNPDTYEILTISHNNAIENFHVLLKTKTLHEDSVKRFIRKFRRQFCTMICNINIYDSRVVTPLIGKYPLSYKEYILFADHFVAASSDVDEIGLWPYQDFKYKKFGGKNWKTKQHP